MNFINPAVGSKLRAFKSMPLVVPVTKEMSITKVVIKPRANAVPYFSLEQKENRNEGVWKESKKIGAYSLLKTDLNGSSLQIIVAASRFNQLAMNFLSSRGLKSINLELLAEFIKSITGSKKNIQIDHNQTFLLEELIFRNPKNFASNIGSVILAQIVLEKFSKIESRIVKVKNISTAVENFSLLIKIGGADFFLFNPESGQISLNNREDLFLRKVKVEHHSVSFGKDKKVAFYNASGSEIVFQISGRTPSENRFAKEAELISLAADDDLVPYEINFHPFWRRYGHTSLRIGESVYEFSSDGWRAHNTGADSARAFLFNNPFMKSRYAVFAPSGMPPVSYGVTRYECAKKVRELQKIIEEKCAYKGPGREKFNLFLFNCNQKLRGVFRTVGIEGFEEKGYLDFSSVLTFNALLNNADFSQKYWMYPLPGIEATDDKIRNWLPKVLYLNNNPKLEIKRAAKSVALDVFVEIAKVLNFITYALFRKKVWNGFTNYQHINERW